MRRLVFWLLAVSVSFARAEQLPLDRILADPGLSGPSVRSLKLSPDGSRVTFLKGKEDAQDRMDLWEWNLRDEKARLLVDSRVLAPEEKELSDEEKDRRERQRISALSGIVDYDFSKDGNLLLFPLSGDVFVYEIASGAVRRVTNTEALETDPKLSPQGAYVSFIRDQDLYVVKLETGEERRLTQDGGGVILNAMAEFIAEEEMNRDTGYWWAPDESAIAFIRVDETPVELVKRYEIYAEEIKIREQRYPYAGTNNAIVRLGVLSPEGGEPRWMDLGKETDVYLARVEWFPDGKRLAVQRESRDQKRLDLLRVDAATGRSKILLSETSETWVEIRNDLAPFKGSEEFLWSSDRSGFRHLYLYDTEGRPIRQVTEGPWSVEGQGPTACRVDETNRLVYFTATEKSPIERHLYVASLDAPGPPKRITTREGKHDVQVAEGCRFFVDTYSDPQTPPQVSIHRMDGSLVAFLEENRLDATHPYHPYLDHHCVPEFGTLKAQDGQLLHYSLTTPFGFDPSRRYPAIVSVYGGPLGQGVLKSWGSMWEQYLAQEGYVVWKLDNRGTGSRGTAFDAPIHLQLGKIEVVDQVTGIEHLRSLPFVDPGRVGIYGWSYGGYMTLMTMMQSPGLLAAGVSGAPVTDWRLYDTHYTERYMGDPKANSAGYEASSVFPYVERLDAPLLVLHGMADDNVLFTNSTKLFRALQSAGKPFEMMTYPGSKHSLLRHPDPGVHGYRTIKTFLDRHLKPSKEDP